MSKQSQRQVVAEIVPVSNATGAITGPLFKGYWAQVSGGEITSSVEKVYDGGETFPETIPAPAEVGDITVTRHYDPDRDGSNLKRLRQMVGRTFYDVTVYDLNADLKQYGTERIYPRCLLIGVSEPEGDSSSGAPATFALTFSVSQVSGI
jgi:hypothetical protein